MSLPMLEELRKILAEAEKFLPPWHKYRRQYRLEVTDHLPPEMSVAKFGDSVNELVPLDKVVFISRTAYRAVKALDWGQVGCPDDNELAAFLAWKLEQQ